MDQDQPLQPTRLPTAREIAAPVFRQYRVAVVCFALAATAVLAVVFMAPRVYEAELKILVKRDRADALVSGNPESSSPDRREVSEIDLLSEVELLKGRDLLEQVARAMKMDQRPEVAERAHSPAEALAAAVASLGADLTVAPIKRTRMIAVTYTARDPREARDVLAALGRLYLEKHLAVRRPPGVHQFFTDQASRSREELDEARGRLEAFTARTHVVSAAFEKESVLQKLAEFEASRRQTDAELAETSRRVGSLESQLTATPASHTAQVRTSDDASLTRDLKSRVLSLELERAELLRKFTPEYRAVKDVEQQLQRARAALDDARRTPVKEETVAVNPIRQWLENELADARANQSALAARSRALGRTVTEYRAKAEELEVHDAEQQDLLRSLKAAEEKHSLYQRKEEEARISDALDRTRIANVSIAQAPVAPTEPRRSGSMLWLFVGLAAAAALSLSAAFVADALSTRIRTPDELRSLLDVPVLASVPAARR